MDVLTDAYFWSGDAKISRRTDYAKRCLYFPKGVSS